MVMDLFSNIVALFSSGFLALMFNPSTSLPKGLCFARSHNTAKLSSFPSDHLLVSNSGVIVRSTRDRNLGRRDRRVHIRQSQLKMLEEHLPASLIAHLVKNPPAMQETQV